MSALCSLIAVQTIHTKHGALHKRPFHRARSIKNWRRCGFAFVSWTYNKCNCCSQLCHCMQAMRTSQNHSETDKLVKLSGTVVRGT